MNLIAVQVRQRTTALECLSVFEWKKEVNSSTRKQSTAETRRIFVDNNLMLLDGVNIQDKSVIILDDQYTTGSTS